MLHPTLRSATVIGLISCVAGLRAETASEQLKSATIVLDEILSAPDKDIPKDLLDNSYCVVVVPGVKKVAFGIGAKYGRGFISCRDLAHSHGLGSTWGCANGGWQSRISNWGVRNGRSHARDERERHAPAAAKQIHIGGESWCGGGPSRTYYRICRDRCTVDGRNSILVPITWSVCRSISWGPPYFPNWPRSESATAMGKRRLSNQEIVRDKEARHPAAAAEAC